MKVFIYYSGYGNKGGITTQACFYAEALVRQGHKVTISGLGRPWWHAVSKKVEGANYVSGSYLPKRRWLSKWEFDAPEMLCARIIKHLRENRYGIVHCLGWHATNINIFWAGMVKGAKTLYTATSTADKVYPADFEKCGLLLDGVHGPSPSIAQAIGRRMNLTGKCYVFPTCPDRLIDNVEQFPKNLNALGFIGHLEEHKQVDRLVRILPHVLDQLDNVHLHFFGNGSLKASLQEQAMHLGVEGNITFHGYESDLRKIFSQISTIIVMAKEGLSLVAVEALCAGRLIVLPKDGCFPEIYGECRASKMFEPDATDLEVADTIAEALRLSQYNSVRKAAREFFEDRFSPKVVSEQLIKCYQDLLLSP